LPASALQHTIPAVSNANHTMLEIVGRVLAGLGAGMILAALTFVTLLIGVLVNAMVVLMAGPVVDKMLKEKA
jgi:hypothetical protein